MSRAAECERCGTLFKKAPGTVWIEGFNIVEREDGMSQGYGSNSGSDFIDFCPACSVEFLKFVKHESEPSEEAPSRRHAPRSAVEAQLPNCPDCGVHEGKLHEPDCPRVPSGVLPSEPKP